MKYLRLLLVFCLIFLLAGCGQYGALYLPHHKQALYSSSNPHLGDSQ